MDDSKNLWLDLHAQIPRHEIRLGPAVANAYVTDPKLLGFIAARYKFIAKMIAGAEAVLEVGCGDGFGAPIVAQAVRQLVCTDIDEATLKDNAERLKVFQNVEFHYFDFRAQAFPEAKDALYSVDVLEHIFPAEEPGFLANMRRSLKPHGIALFGTPNITSEQYASQYSRQGHVNLKDHQTLRAALIPHFHNIFVFSMNDEVVHTGYYPMAHYLWALCVSPKTA
jgi:SAM-dependent methyltransferase